jgi:hypothetical protein
VWLGFWAVLVVPSPKFHDQEVGLAVDMSVNWTACPAVGVAGLKVNDEVRTDILATVTLLLPCFDVELSLTVKVTS